MLTELGMGINNENGDYMRDNRGECHTHTGQRSGGVGNRPGRGEHLTGQLQTWQVGAVDKRVDGN